MTVDASGPASEVPREDAPHAREPSGIKVAPARGRVGAALRCPYCHDAVGRRGAVLCERDGCGALYHRECWDACAGWDGCAALGCGSRVARELSALEYVVRLVRLGLAALVLPRRIVHALRAAGAPGVPSIHRQALEKARVFLPTKGATQRENTIKLLYFMNTLPLGTIGLLFLMDRYLIPLEAIPRGIPFVPALPLIFAVLLWLALPFAVALAVATVLQGWRALAHAFRAELAALERGEASSEASGPSPARRARGEPKKTN